MTMERYVRLFARSFVLLQSSLTGFCPLVNILQAIGVKRAVAVDP
jgi:hypothetical protein